MKGKVLSGKPYANLIKKLFFQTLTILFAAIIFVLILRLLGRGYLGNLITEIICRIKGLSWSRSVLIYNIYIKSNIDIIMMVAIIIFFIILFRLSLTWFTKYFDDIVDGVDLLAGEGKDKISMRPELEFVEEKLNEAKDKLERRAKEAREAEQQKNDLVVYLAHDIKTPLTSVIGYLSLLYEKPDMPSENKEKYIGTTLEKAYQLEQLINEFFEITRFNLQTIVLQKEEINLSFMFMQMVDEFYPMFQSKGLDVKIDLCEGLMLKGDADKLARVFNNILKNAVAYSYQNSIITISAKQEKDNIVISFNNHGDNIPQNKLDMIFERFYRLDDARSTDTGGAGLGLAIAKEIVTAHGGTVIAKSNDNFTTFIITLPKDC